MTDHIGPGSQPSDNTTLASVLDGYRSDGFDADFSAEAGAMVRCGRCASTVEARGMPMHSLRRLEGASDPADMIAVVATSCPVCGAEGTLVLAYGPMASEEDADVLAALRDVRRDDVLPPSSSTDELPHGTQDPADRAAHLPSGGEPPTDSTVEIVTDQTTG